MTSWRSNFFRTSSAYTTMGMEATWRIFLSILFFLFAHECQSFLLQTQRKSLSSFYLRSNIMEWSELEKALPKEDKSTTKLTLYRDTNGWCPFCERVWIALEMKGIEYEEKTVDLRNKPEWYKKIVPTTLVPAVELHDESYDPSIPGSGRLVCRLTLLYYSIKRQVFGLS